ncbi:urea amidolyase family protein [Georgenia sp. H159]|uniref:5-oxoprolinase subunit B/C family protein n=1 Tax=Georgenia sp. H159 TaxID=3076115 RepID=UPI002D787859|nr:urea amidolyase family protein [Georgenia sp. H159]
MSGPPGVRTVHLMGERGLLVECGDLAEVLGLHAELTAHPLPGQVEVLAAARTVLVRAADRRARDRLVPRLRAVPAAAAARSEGAELTLDTVYDGADLTAVADLTGTSPEAVVAAHTGQRWTAAFGGFAPGFTYLVGEDPTVEVPRRPSPRTSVPRGAVGLAGPFSAVYPRSSPGGWQLIGRTDAPMWDLERVPPALLRPGDTVRFRAVRELVSGRTPGGPPGDATARARRRGADHRHPAPAGGLRDATRGLVTDQSRPGSAPPLHPPTAALRVVSPGSLSLVQDLGRPGLLDLGVSPSGAADRGSAAQANRLVGNDRSAAVVETVLGGLELEAVGDHVVAVSGAPVPLAVLRDDVEVAHPSGDVPFALPDGHRLRLDHPRRGLRAYVAVRGGLAVPAVLGSRSTDVLSRIGPEPLNPGTVLPVGPPPPSAVALGEPARVHPTDPVSVAVVLGPRADWVTPDSLEAFLTRGWTVTDRSNRVGVRLAGEPMQRAADAELPSEPTVAGAVQVPTDGLPVVFLADHPVTGGYPVIAVVTGAGLDLLAQVRPGQDVRFHVDDGG